MTNDLSTKETENEVDEIKTNRFLVRFNCSSEIDFHEWHVQSVETSTFNLLCPSSDTNEIILIMRSMSNCDAKTIEMWKKFNGKKVSHIDIEYLDKTGDTISADRYTNPIAKSIKFAKCDYNDGCKTRTYVVTINFDEMTEANKQLNDSQLA